MYKLGFEEEEEPAIELPTSIGSWRKQGSSRKTSTSASLLWASLEAQLVKNLPAMWETSVQSLGWEDPVEKGKATLSGILA